MSLPPPGALARVNDEYLTAAQIDREILVNRVYASLSADAVARAETRTAILERLITQRLEAQAASRAGATVTDGDLDATITQMSAHQHWSLEQLGTALTRQGLTRADLRGSLRDVLLVTRYADDVLTQGAGNSPAALTQQQTWAQQVVRAGRVVRYGDPEGTQAPRPGAPAPDFTLADLTGRPTTLAAFRGRPVLLNFWAPWCQPCRTEMPLLTATYRQAQTTGDPGQALVVLAVAINSAPDTMRAFRDEFQVPFPILHDPDLAVASRYGLGPIPTSFLIDRGGVIRWVQVGTWSDALLRDKLPLTP